MQLLRRRPLSVSRPPDGRRNHTLRLRRCIETQCFGQGRRGAYRAVQGAVRRVNHFLHRHENIDDASITPEITTPKIVLNVRTQCSTRVKEVTDRDSTLQAYLRLPVSEYSLLDPEWIQSLPEQSEPTFRVTLPVYELLGIDTGAVVADVRTRRNPAESCVTMQMEGVTFGRDELDKILGLNLRLVLFIPSSRRKWMPFGRRRYREVDSFLENVNDLHQIQSATETALLDAAEHLSSAEEISDESVEIKSDDAFDIETEIVDGLEEEEEGEHWTRLNCAVQLSLRISIPPIVASIPRMVLAPVGRILLRTILSNVLPNFLKLVVEDYHAWSIGAPRSVKKRGGLYATDPKDNKGILFENDE